MNRWSSLAVIVRSFNEYGKPNHALLAVILLSTPVGALALLIAAAILKN